MILIAIAAFMVGEYAGEKGGLYLFSEPEVAVTCPVVQNGVATCPACPEAEKGMKTTSVSSDCEASVKDKLVSVGLMPATVTSLNGVTVKSASGKNIVVEVDARYLNPLTDGKKTLTVTVPDDVKIEERVSKPIDSVMSALEEFQKKSEALNARSAEGEDVMSELIKLTPPVTFDIKNLSVSDLKVGDLISLTSEANIRESDTFSATEVQLISRAAVVSVGEPVGEPIDEPVVDQ